MLMLSIALLILGLVFLAVEFSIPGFGVCGITGIALIIVSVIITILKIPLGPYIIAAELVGIGIFGYFALMYVKKRQLYGKLILDETLNFEQKKISDLDMFIGKEGIAKTSLKPFGKVSLNGVDIDAWAEIGYIPENVKVKVVGVENDKIFVKQINAN